MADARIESLLCRIEKAIIEKSKEDAEVVSLSNDGGETIIKWYLNYVYDDENPNTPPNVQTYDMNGNLLTGYDVVEWYWSAQSIVNEHAEVIDTDSITLSNISNYSYSVISWTATVTIDGVSISGIPAGFDARQGDSKPDQLGNTVTITGETVGTRVIIYFER